MEVANKCAEVNNIEACSVDELIKDKEIEIILNLTIPKAHYEIAKKSLENGKHIYSEKPMAVNFEDGKHLLQLSTEKGLYIGNAPDTFLGGGIQKSIELVPSYCIDFCRYYHPSRYCESSHCCDSRIDFISSKHTNFKTSVTKQKKKRKKWQIK